LYKLVVQEPVDQLYNAQLYVLNMLVIKLIVVVW